MPSRSLGMTEDADAKVLIWHKPVRLKRLYVATKDENLSVLGQSGTGQVSDKRRAN